MKPSHLLSTCLLLTAALTACTDDPGQIDEPTVTRVVVEAPGANCADGGSAVQLGVDDDGDGTLGDAEVDRTVYVCDRATLRLVAEPAGANCADGGTAIQLGDDVDGDSVLDAAEVRETTYLCGTEQTLLTRVDPESFEAPCPGGGSISVGYDLDDDHVLADDEVIATEWVCGGFVEGLYLENDADVAAAQHIRGVTGGFGVGPDVTSVDLPNLIYLGGPIDLQDCALTSLRLSGVMDFKDFIRIQGCAQLTEIDVSGALTFHGDITIRDSGLTSLAFSPVRAEVAGQLILSGNPALQALRLDGTTLRDGLVAYGNPALREVAIKFRPSWLPFEEIDLHDNDALETVSIDIGSVHRMYLRRNPALTTVSLNRGVSTLTLQSNPALATVTGKLSGKFAQVTDTQLTNVDFLSPYTDELILNNNARLTVVDTEASHVQMSGNPALTRATFRGVAFYRIFVYDNAALEELTFPELVSVEDEVVVSTNPALVRFGFPGTYTDSFSIQNNRSLPTCEILALFARVSTLNQETQSGNYDAATCPTP